jgi:hypothetical protein
MNKLLIVAIVFAVACVLMFKYLPVWVSLIIVVLGLFSLRWVVPRLAKRLFMAPFKMKGKALAGADVSVHAVRPADAPERQAFASRIESDADREVDGEGIDGEEEDDDYGDDGELDYTQYAWYHVDVTITPHPTGEGFTFWEPGELMLVSPDANAEDIEDHDDGVAHVHDLRVFMDGAFREYDGEKYEGPQRLELHLGVKPGVNALQFRYYFELFGHVPVPVKPIP